ncbi:HD family phosphohydrolase [Planococcus glaciei]|uniref:HD family phosphohydrolase n=1 Tax=Planococcus glaciei TaxID=459472 RepID=UPI00094470E5|nr:HD family phosphohydrolase [Planococcus glaciei]
MRKKAEQLYEKAGYKLVAAILVVAIGAIMYAFLYSSLQTDKYSIELFQLSEEPIRSAKTVVDPFKTELERERAASEVQPSYQFNEEIAANQAAVVDSLFGYILEAKSLPDNKDGKPVETDQMIESLQENIRLMETSDNGLKLTDEMLRALLVLPPGKLQEVQQFLTGIVLDTLEHPIREDEVAAFRNAAEQEIRKETKIPASILQAAVMIGRASIIPNEVVNEELTNAQLEQARASVEPTRILQGQVLVQEGQVVDREVYRQLELAGMTEDQQDYKPLFGLLLFVVIAVAVLAVMIRQTDTTEQKKITALLVVFSVLAFSMAIMEIIHVVSGNFDVVIAFLFPTALAGMIARMLLNERIAVCVTFLTGALGGMLLQEGSAAVIRMDLALYIIFGGLIGVYLIKQDDRRTRLLQTSVAVAMVNALFVGFYLLVGQSQYDWTEISFYFSAAVISGLLSGALAIGLLPFFESAFGLLSTMKLIELSNPNHPLLKKILTETPGTYHHSVMVANLADASCEAIGANGLLARVGCYYHDIGKTKQPHFFIENQMHMRNPHDSLPPETSSRIILEHGTYGAELLRKHKMPKEIVDVAAQHHGTSLLKFFYHKAKEQNPEVDEAMYRYSGPKPQTKEIAIISVADSVEAAVRSMKEPTSEKIKNLVDAIVEDKLKDGQFEECDLTMKELKTVKHIMCETLNGIFHSRIEYPKEPTRLEE